jgi:hypothetical protein
MNTPDASSWRHLYRAAILETDQNDIPYRIAEARKAIVCRVRYLFLSTEPHLDEKEALTDAMYALQALQTSLQHRECQHVTDIDRMITAA